MPYTPDLKDLMTCFAMLLHTQGGKVVVKRQAVVDINARMKSLIRAEYHPASDDIVITVEHALSSGIVIPNKAVVSTN